jgi:DNA-directed RNA polymerase specialized sigma24 family protein
MIHSDPTNTGEPVTAWLRLLEGGQSEAAQPLWDHFCRKLLELASHRLGAKLRRSYDEEDVALSAFHSLCRVISDGRQSDLSNRDNLWRLLVTITERKILARLKYETRQKRDVRRSLSESCLMLDHSDALGLQALPGREPTPEFAIEFADICEALLDDLDDETLRQIVQLRLTNHDNAEIAAKLGLTRRTIERKLLVVQGRWRKLACETE